jgi:hypothetical protein
MAVPILEGIGRGVIACVLADGLGMPLGRTWTGR